MPAKQSKSSTDRIEVTLAVDHTHRGVELKPGAKITVRKPLAQWMSDNNIIKEQVN